MLSMGISPLNDPFDFDFDEKQDDPCSEDLAQLILCPDCKTRSKVCPNCKLRNSPLSLVESKEDQLIFGCISIMKGEKSDYVLVDYPFPPHFSQLYHPSKSNIHLAEKTTANLFKKLHARKIVKQFDDEIRKSINEDNMVVLTQQERIKALNGTHCFSFLNYAEKLGSTSHKIRAVSNTSSNHQSGSINSWLPSGSNLISNLKEVFESFRLETFVLVTDISRCYRSVRTSEAANMSRLHIYPENPFDPKCLNTVILKYLRLTFGDAIAANVIEQIMIYFVTQKTENELTKMFLKFYRFVDDFAMGNANKELLFQAAVDLQKSLNSLDFHLKRILSNQSWHLKENVTPLGPQWSIPAFPGEIEQLFGHLWSHHEDTIQPKTQLFIGKKTRGAFKGVQFCQVDTFIITKRLLSSLIGQCYSLDGTFLSPLRCALKILFHQVCSLTQEWNLNVSDTKVGKLCQQFLQLLKKRINDFKSH